MKRETIAAKVREQKWSDKMADEKGTPATYHLCRSCNQPARTTNGRAFCAHCTSAVTTQAVPVTEKILRTYVTQKAKTAGGWR